MTLLLLPILLKFQEKDILYGKGSITNEEAEDIVHHVYETFNTRRKKLEVQAADAEDLKMLEDIEKSILGRNKEQ